jgi:RNA polymerase sigma-70 factor (ECF subfamily)
VTKNPERCDSDFSLIRKAQRGEVEAFASLYEEHKERIYSVCLRMTNNAADAEDLTQEAFIQVFRKIATFRGDSALATWLYRVAVNTVLMYFRRKEARPVSLDDRDVPGRSSIQREYGVYDDSLTGCLDRITLARAISQLPAGYRTIYLMHEVQGYRHHEIASLLDCSAGNSKSQLHKAKVRIRELLGRGQEVEKVTLAALTSNDSLRSHIICEDDPTSNVVSIGAEIARSTVAAA